MKNKDNTKRIECRLNINNPTQKAVWDKIQNSGDSMQRYIVNAILAYNPDADAPVKAMTANAEISDEIIDKIAQRTTQLIMQEIPMNQISDNNAKHTEQEAEEDASEETEETDKEEQELSPEDQAFLRSIGAWD